MTTPQAPGAARNGPDHLKDVEAALKRFGYARVAATRSDPSETPEFWVQESGVPRRTFPVFVDAAAEGASRGSEPWAKAPARASRASSRRAIVVVASDRLAEETWTTARGPLDSELAILVVPRRPGRGEPHWHSGIVTPKDLLRLATGVVVGLFRRARAEDGSSQIDFEEMLGILKNRFRIDVHRSLGVSTDEEALFLLYQLAQRDAYAPGDPAANLHLLVLKPTGPAARLPWFAA